MTPEQVLDTIMQLHPGLSVLVCHDANHYATGTGTTGTMWGITIIDPERGDVSCRAGSPDVAIAEANRQMAMRQPGPDGQADGLADAPFGVDRCEARGPEEFYCTRPVGHAGDHVARSGVGVIMDQWPNPQPAGKAADHD